MKTLFLSIILIFSAIKSDTYYKYILENINTCEKGTFWCKKEYFEGDTISFKKQTFEVIKKELEI
jgi:hypothetical protein